MKQPELGKKVAALRMEKGLTQEELVDKCNINVRTIQRIESGDVTPRPLTLRLILEALDYDFEMLNQELHDSTENSSQFWLKQLQNFFLIGFDPSKNLNISARVLQFAWIAGLSGFIIGFPESGMEYSQYYHRFDPDLNLVYTLVKVASFIAMVFMLRGFIILGDFHHNYLLKISSYLLIIHGLFTAVYDTVSVYLPAFRSEHADGGIAITLGAILLLFGASLQKMKTQYGRAAGIAAVLALIAGSLLITLILWWMGLLFMIPLELLEIVILYKGYEMFVREEGSSIN
jgi:transcriptional regulator with XRE-family HTH domain